MKFPNTAERIHRKRFEWFTRDAVHRATRLCAISQSTKDDVCEYFKISSDKVDVVHLGVDLETYHPCVQPGRRSNPYILAVGTIQPRKNYGMLFRAFRDLCRMHPDSIDLLIVGQRGWLWEGIERDAQEGDFRSRIYLLGYVPEEQMPGLYAGASMVVMPSLYEGFGIPLLEAMACGTPVVSSNASSLPEVVGDAGVLINPTDRKAWTEAMSDLLTNAQQRSDLRLRGIERAKRFSWLKTAQGTLEVYKRTMTS
jgi:glycosyltransferase involved in cell wall biosynthesis